MKKWAIYAMVLVFMLVATQVFAQEATYPGIPHTGYIGAKHTGQDWPYNRFGTDYLRLFGTQRTYYYLFTGTPTANRTVNFGNPLSGSYVAYAGVSGGGTVSQIPFYDASGNMVSDASFTFTVASKRVSTWGIYDSSGIVSLADISGNSMHTSSFVSTGPISGTSVTASGDVSGNTVHGSTITASGDVSGNSVHGSSIVASGPMSGASVTASGDVSGNTVHGSTITASGDVSGNSLHGSSVVSSGAISGTSITGSGDVSGNTVHASTVTASGDVSGNSVHGSTIVASGTVTGVTITASGDVSGNSVHASSATFSGLTANKAMKTGAGGLLVSATMSDASFEALAPVYVEVSGSYTLTSLQMQSPKCTIVNAGSGSDASYNLPVDVSGNLACTFQSATTAAVKWGVHTTTAIVQVADSSPSLLTVAGAYARFDQAVVGQSFKCWSQKSSLTTWGWICKPEVITAGRSFNDL